MNGSKKIINYLNNENLIIEIVKSKNKQKENPQLNPTECLTPNLVLMLKKLVDRYAQHTWWRGYCVDIQTQALTKRGWLGINDINENDIILSCEHEKLKWSGIKSIYKNHYKGKMFRLTLKGFDALITPGHKFVTTNGLIKVEHLRQKDRLVLLGKAVDCAEGYYTDEFVELIGWAITEGNFDQRPERKYYRVAIWQNEGAKANRIRNCLNKLGAKFSEYARINPTGKSNVRFLLSKRECQLITEVAPNRVPSMSFILSLTPNQRELMIQTMLDGDGWTTIQGTTTHRGYCQKDKKHIDALLALLTINGCRASAKQHDIISFGKPTKIYIVTIFSKKHDYAMVENIDFHGGQRNTRFFTHEPTVEYDDMVWCPETEFGSFVARRNGYVYLTGNSYNDDFKGEALLALCQNALKFNEEKYNNPFGYYTQIARNSFMSYKDKEYRMRDIKDNLIMLAPSNQGMAPSMTRQIENERLAAIPYRAPREAKRNVKEMERLEGKSKKTKKARNAKKAKGQLERIDNLIITMNNLDSPNTTFDRRIAGLLRKEILQYTGHVNDARKLLPEGATCLIETDQEIAGSRGTLVTVLRTGSKTQRIIAIPYNRARVPITIAIMALTLHRDRMNKRLKELKGMHSLVSRIIPVNEDRQETSSYDDIKPASRKANKAKLGLARVSTNQGKY